MSALTISLRQAMTPVHTWTGLALGWLLYFMFITGTLGYFDTEIDQWMQPELPRQQAAPQEALGLAESWLRAEAAGAERWFIDLPGSREHPNLGVFWIYAEAPPGREPRGDAVLDLETGAPFVARETAGGQRLYRMHYNLHYLPRTAAHYLVGVASMFMLLAIVTGVIIHKKIFRDFFTFRPAKCQRGWLDAHNMLSVLALPFHLMITYSGLLFFAFLYLPGILLATYGSGPEARDQFGREMQARMEPPKPAGEAARLAPLGPMLAHAGAVWDLDQIYFIRVDLPGDAHARVSFFRQPDSIMTRGSTPLVFDGVSGAPLAQPAAALKPPTRFFYAMLGLHEGRFADSVLRWLYFLSGIMGSAMIAAGLVLWSVKRKALLQTQRQPARFGHRLVEALNISTLVGLPVGIAAFFWANRLLPLALAERAEWEIHVLFIAWLAMLLFVLARPAARAWRESLWIAAAAFALLPALNAITTERHLMQSLAAGDWVFAGFDLCMLAFALGFALAAQHCRRRERRAASLDSAIPAGSA